MRRGVVGIKLAGVVESAHGLVEGPGLKERLAEHGLKLADPWVEQGGGEHFTQAGGFVAVGISAQSQAQVRIAQGGIGLDRGQKGALGVGIVARGQPQESIQAQDRGFAGGDGQGPVQGGAGFVEVLGPQLQAGQIDERLDEVGIQARGPGHARAGLGKIEDGDVRQSGADQGQGRVRIRGQGLSGMGAGRGLAVCRQIDLGAQGVASDVIRSQGQSAIQQGRGLLGLSGHEREKAAQGQRVRGLNRS